MKRLKLSTCLALLVLCLDPAPAAARPDIIFQVPEVLVRHAAVPRPVGTGATLNVTRGNGSANEVHLQRTDYYVEHEISTSDARIAARMMKLYEVPKTLPGCGKCQRWEMEYCQSNVLADHCCCERRFLREPFAWMPHTCYIGPERCTTLADNCAHYTRIRDCCCYRKLAEKWKMIMSKGTALNLGNLALIAITMIYFTLYL